MNIERDEPMFELVDDYDDETRHVSTPVTDERALEDDEDDSDGEE